MKNMSFEMFTKAGDKACQGLVNRLSKKIRGTKRLTMTELDELIDKGMEKIALKHPEVFDTEPRYHIRHALDKVAIEMGYKGIYDF